MASLLEPVRTDTILVLADPAESQVANAKCNLAGVTTVAGDSVGAFEHAAADASVLFNWSGTLALFRKSVWNCPNLRWVHSRSVGLGENAVSRS